MTLNRPYQQRKSHGLIPTPGNSYNVYLHFKYKCPVSSCYDNKQTMVLYCFKYSNAFDYNDLQMYIYYKHIRALTFL